MTKKQFSESFQFKYLWGKVFGLGFGFEINDSMLEDGASSIKCLNLKTYLGPIFMNFNIPICVQPFDVEKYYK